MKLHAHETRLHKQNNVQSVIAACSARTNVSTRICSVTPTCILDNTIKHPGIRKCMHYQQTTKLQYRLTPCTYCHSSTLVSTTNYQQHNIGTTAVDHSINPESTQKTTVRKVAPTVTH